MFLARISSSSISRMPRATGSHLRCRQDHHGAGAASLRCVKLEAPRVTLEDAPGEREAEAEPVGLGGEERAERLAGDLLRHARSAVLDGDGDRAVAGRA